MYTPIISAYFLHVSESACRSFRTLNFSEQAANVLTWHSNAHFVNRCTECMTLSGIAQLILNLKITVHYLVSLHGN